MAVETLEALRARRDEAQFELDRMTAGVADRKAEVSTLTKRITALLRAPAPAEELPLFDRAEVFGTAFGIDIPEPLEAPVEPDGIGGETPIEELRDLAARLVAGRDPTPPARDEEPSAPDPLDGQIVGPSGEVEDIGLATPGPAYTWHSYPIEKVLGAEFHGVLAAQLVAGDLGTLGAVASWLSDGNNLDDTEIPTAIDAQGNESRPLGRGEVKILRAALLRTVYHLKIEAEFPPALIDPEIGRTVQPIEAAPRKPSLKKAAKAKAKPAPDPEPADGLAVFAVRPSRAKPPLYFVRAWSLREAIEHVKASHPKDARMIVGPHDGAVPKGSWVQKVKEVNL